MVSDERLLPCPFCGVVPQILICDDEGNVHEEDGYMDDPWSGLTFAISHHCRQDGAVDCPIATFNLDDEILGTRLYYSIDELVETWNSRCLHQDDDIRAWIDTRDSEPAVNANGKCLEPFEVRLADGTVRTAYYSSVAGWSLHPTWYAEHLLDSVRFWRCIR